MLKNIRTILVRLNVKIHKMSTKDETISLSFLCFRILSTGQFYGIHCIMAVQCPLYNIHSIRI